MKKLHQLNILNGKNMLNTSNKKYLKAILPNCILILFYFSLLGCNTDPDTSGTLGAIIGINNGDWDRQITEREKIVNQKSQILKGIQSENNQLSYQEEQLNNIVQREQKKLSQLSEKLIKIEQGLIDTTNNINLSNIKKNNIRQQIQELSRKIKEIQLQIKNGKYARQEKQLISKRQEIEKEKEELDMLMAEIDY